MELVKCGQIKKAELLQALSEIENEEPSPPPKNPTAFNRYIQSTTGKERPKRTASTSHCLASPVKKAPSVIHPSRGQGEGQTSQGCNPRERPQSAQRTKHTIPHDKTVDDPEVSDVPVLYAFVENAKVRFSALKDPETQQERQPHGVRAQSATSRKQGPQLQDRKWTAARARNVPEQRLTRNSSFLVRSSMFQSMQEEKLSRQQDVQRLLEARQCRFKPQINPASHVSRPGNVHDRLYEIDRLQRMKNEAQRAEKLKQDALLEISVCTFKPRILANHGGPTTYRASSKPREKKPDLTPNVVSPANIRPFKPECRGT